MANATKVSIDYMMKKDFKKEAGYDDLVKKVYEKTKSAKPKALTANVSLAKMTFQPGKGKPPVTGIANNKIRQVKKGQAKDKVVVLVTEGDAKKKTHIYGLRFANEEDAKVFYDTAKLKGVKPAESTPAPAPAPVPTPGTASRASVTSLTPRRSPPPPITPTPPSHSRANSITHTMTDNRISPSRGSSPPTPRPPTMQRHASYASTVSRASINDMQPAAPLPRAQVSPSPSPVSRTASKSPISRTASRNEPTVKSRTQHSPTSVSSTSSPTMHSTRYRSSPPQQRRPSPRPAYQAVSDESRTTFISTDPNDYAFMANGGKHKKRRPAPAPPSNGRSTYASNDSDAGTHRSRRSVESVRILQLVPEPNPMKPESGRMLYFTSPVSSSSSSSSSSRSSSSSSSASIATKWIGNRSAISSKQERSSGYRVRGEENYVEFSPRPYSSSSSSSSSRSASPSSSERSERVVRQWRIQRITSSRSTSSSSTSSSSSSSLSAIPLYQYPKSRGRSNQPQAYRLITPR